MNAVRDISVGIVTRPWAGRLMNRGSVPSRAREFHLHNIQTGSESHPAPIQWASVAVSPGVKRQERGADHSPPTSAEVKSGGATPSLLHMSSWCCA
jgi:hypothetical protein